LESKEKNAYILGTDREELRRLGYQHQVWSSEARRGWEIAGFSMGDELLDLGCGPGFCTQELGYLVGTKGKVIGIDKSESYIQYLDEIATFHNLNIETQACDFNDMELSSNSLDGAYCRWALAWIPNPHQIIAKVSEALKPGGRFVVQEYYDWSTFQTTPEFPNLKEAIFQALTSFDNGIGEINIGKKTPKLFELSGLSVYHTRPLSKMAKPHDLVWQWPKTFLQIYLPKVVEMGKLKAKVASEAMKEFTLLEKSPGASLLAPAMIEVIGEKKLNTSV